MAQQKLNSKVRQEQYARAALSLIAAEGLKHLSVAGVARRVGLVPSALYRHYRGKDALLEAVIALIGQQLHANIERALARNGDALEQLRRLLLAHARVIRENEGVLRVILSDELEDGARKQQTWEMVSSYLAGVAQIVRNGQRNGLIRRELDPGTVSVMFLGLIQPAAILWNLSGTRFDLVRHVRKAWPVLRSAIATE